MPSCGQSPWGVDAHIVIDKLLALQLGAVACQNFRVIGHHRAVIVVVAQTLVNVVSQTGVEDGIQVHLAQGLDVAVAQLGREAGGIAGDGGLTARYSPRLDTGLVCTAKPSFVQKAHQKGSSS